MKQQDKGTDGPAVFKIGRLGKAHGVKGELTMMFDDDVFDRADADYLFLEVDGLLVPFFIEEYRFRSDTTALIKFEDVDTQHRARELTGCDVYFPYALVPDDEEESLTMSFFVGFDIVDADTGDCVGSITAFDDSTANLLFELTDGRLLPAHHSLIAAIDKGKRQIAMHIPPGLLSL